MCSTGRRLVCVSVSGWTSFVDLVQDCTLTSIGSWNTMLGALRQSEAVKPTSSRCGLVTLVRCYLHHIFQHVVCHWVTPRWVAWCAPHVNRDRRSTSAGMLFITRHLTSRGLMNVSNPVLLRTSSHHRSPRQCLRCLSCKGRPQLRRAEHVTMTSFDGKWERS